MLWTALVLFTTSCHSQEPSADQLLQKLPDITLDDNVQQQYRITTDYFNGDIFGNFLNKTRLVGEYTRGLEDGKVRWNNVYVQNSNSREGEYPTGETLEYMEDFQYRPDENMLLESSFAGFPPNSIQAKNLVWDVMGLETFAWAHFDSLQLNESFRANEINGELDLAGEGSFENKDVRLKWIGISKMNDERCALINYRTFDNPLKMKNEQMEIKGRSHYWGTIWVSLKDKEIEHAVLYEDVVMDIKFGGQPTGQLLNATREIIFERI